MVRTAKRKRSRTEPGATALGMRTSSLNRLLRRYAGDPRFGKEFANLFHRHETALRPAARDDPWLPLDDAAATSPPLAAYVEEVTALARKWGLDRIGDDRGRAFVHEWCVGKALGGDKPPRIGLGIPGDPEPAVGESVEHQIPLGDGTTIAVAWPEPVVRLAIEGRWYPQRESRVAAETRFEAAIGRELAAELDRIERGAERAGYAFPDTHPATVRHLEWLFRRLAYGESWEMLAANTERTADAAYTTAHIRRAVAELAAKIGVSLPRRPRKGAF